MNRQYSSKTAVRILCALFVLISAAVAVAGPVDSAQAQAPVPQAEGLKDTWAVQISPGTDPDQLALQMGAQNLGQIGSLTNYYLFRIPGTDSELTAMADVFAANSQVVWFEQQVARQQTKRAIEDPVYLDQWHLVNANVEPAWTAGFTGTGVNIAIVDDGMQHTHPDLLAQYKSVLSHDYNGDAPLFAEDGDPEDPTYNDYHGTASAGMAAADYNGNALATSCGVGVAYDAGLSGLRLIAAPSTPDQVARALNFGMNPASPGADFNSIYSNSWGPADNMTEPLVGPGTLELAALQAGVTFGRNGKGSIYVWAAGNGLASKDNVNYDGYANSRFTIAVGAVDHLGEQASYSEPGAAMLVTAPSTSDTSPEAIVTTDLLGYRGYNFFGDCTDGIYGGTSAAAPIVSGVVALMLDANPNLGWRDIQNILARTAVKNDEFDEETIPNPDGPEFPPVTVSTWVTNSAGLHVNHKYGFGLVDAAAAVAMAADPLYVNLRRDAIVSSGTIPVNLEVPDLNADPYGDGIVSEFLVTKDITLEHVEVVFNSSAIPCIAPRLTSCGGFRGDLKLVLTAPSGTQSVLAEWHDDPENDYAGWKFMTVRNWGEMSAGLWTLKVTDTSGVGFSTFDSWQLILHGTGPRVSFSDVSNEYWAWGWIEGFYDYRITNGCAIDPLRYCPERQVTRAEMAVFVLRAKNDSLYLPPDQSGTFADVPVGGKEWMMPWIEQFFDDGITTGCALNPLRYCPERSVTRAEMAVFLLRAKNGAAYQPPPVSSSVFTDVPVSGKEWMRPWIEEFYRQGYTTGCATSPLRYCPERNVTRAEMAVFISRVFNILPLQ